MGAPFRQNPDVNWVTDKNGIVLGFVTDLGTFVGIPTLDPVTGDLVTPGGSTFNLGPIVTTWAARAALVSAGQHNAFFTDVGIGGGSHWYYSGGKWRPLGGKVMLYNLTAPISTQVTALGVLLSVAIPAGLWQDGDILEWTTSHSKEGGTSETATCDWRIGASDVSIGSALGLSTSSLATTQTHMNTTGRIRRLTSTTAQNLSTTGAIGYGQGSYPVGTRTIPDAEAASYWQALGNLNTGAETLWLRGASLYLEAGS